jgi:hypothetical protein
MTAADHVRRLLNMAACSRQNYYSGTIPAKILSLYEAQHEYPVKDDLTVWQNPAPS